ncbi:MAG: YbhB/YbcL family Raf kinase inhibitor-like protein [Gammaproteobacteria bacterium]
MRLEIKDVIHNAPIPDRFAFGVADEETHVVLGENLNPAVSWSDLPDGTRSLILICVDSDVPTKPDDVNQEDRAVPADLPRTDFYHWTMVDIPPQSAGIEEGSCSHGVTARGKRNPGGPEGSRQGMNDYTGWFEGDPDMGGTYLGYDGPCPPWNDSILHHYHFILYATDLDRCAVDGNFGGAEVQDAIAGHVLGEARVTGTYTLNPGILSR